MFQVIMITYPLQGRTKWAGPFNSREEALRVALAFRTNATSGKVDFEVEETKEAC